MTKAKSLAYSVDSPAYAAKRAADVVYVLQNKNRLDYAELVTSLNETLLLYGKNSSITSADLDELKAVSRQLHMVFAAIDVNAAAIRLNNLLRQYAHVPRLSAHGETSWHIHVDNSDDADWAEWFAASSAMALATLLAEKQQKPGGLCCSASCKRPFIDLGKGGGRRYCSPRCATRERVAAHRSSRYAI